MSYKKSVEGGCRVRVVRDGAQVRLVGCPVVVDGIDAFAVAVKRVIGCAGGDAPDADGAVEGARGKRVSAVSRIEGNRHDVMAVSLKLDLQLPTGNAA